MGTGTARDGPGFLAPGSGGALAFHKKFEMCLQHTVNAGAGCAVFPGPCDGCPLLSAAPSCGVTIISEFITAKSAEDMSNSVLMASMNTLFKAETQ